MKTVAKNQKMKHLLKLLRQSAKLFVCLSLCCSLVFGYSYKEPMQVHAAAVGVEVGIDALIIAALAALGVGVAGTVPDNDYAKVIQKIATEKVKSAAVLCTGAVVGGQIVASVTSDFLKAVGDAFNMMIADNAKVIDTSKWTIPGESSNMTTINDIARGLGFTNYTPNSGTAVYGYSIMAVLVGTSSAVTGLTATGNASYKNSNLHYSNGSQWVNVPWLMNGNTLGYVISYLVPVNYSDGTMKLFRYCTLFSFTAACIYACPLDESLAPGALPDGIGHDVINVANDKFYADGASIINNSIDDVVGRVGTAVGVKDDNGNVTSYPLNIPVGADKSIGKARDVSQDKVLGKDISSTQDKEKDETTNKDKDTTLPKPATMPDLALPEIIFKEKFPFCLPWDLFTAFSNLVAPAQPPKWEVPFKIQSLNFEQNVAIDFSGFSVLASILRWGLSVIFVIWLILLTRKIIGQ